MPENTAIAVFCYKRASKLKQAIEALLKNPECSSMEVVFFCDGAKNEKDAPGVAATRQYVQTITGFRKIICQFRETNISTGPNFNQGINYMTTNYSQFMVVEDDLVVSPNYIRYMLDALRFYKNQPDVFCISGYCFPIQKGNYFFDTVVHTRFCSYGWAIWSDRIADVLWDKDQLSSLIKYSPGFKSRLNKEGMDLFRMLKKQINGIISTWDIQMQVHVAEHHLKVIYPVLSKTHNIGFDNESTNTFGVDYLKTVTDPGEKRNFSFCDASRAEPFIQRQLKKPYTLTALVTRKITNTIIKMSNNLKRSIASI